MISFIIIFLSDHICNSLSTYNMVRTAYCQSGKILCIYKNVYLYNSCHIQNMLQGYAGKLVSEICIVL